MKKLIVTIALIASVLVGVMSTTGCRTTGTNPADSGSVTNNTPFIYVDSQGLLVVGGVVVSPVIVGSTVGTGTTLGIAHLVRNNTNSIAYLVITKQLIDSSIANGQYDPNALLAALKASTANGVNSDPAIQAIIVAAVNTYATYYSALTAQGLSNTSPYLKPILQGISDGIANVISPKQVPVGIMRE